MKRDQCLHSAKRISEHDATIVATFRAELGLFKKLKDAGHSHDCATWMMWDNKTCTCGL